VRASPSPALRRTLAAWALAAYAVAAKDLRVHLRRPWQAVGILLVPLSYTIVALLGSQAVGANPVAVVNADHGPAGAQITSAIDSAGVFRLTETGPAQASRMYAGQQVAAVVTIPAGTSALLREHRHAVIGVRLHNMDLDLADDIRRGVPDAVVSWYLSRQPAGPVRAVISETKLRAQDVPLYEYSILPVIVLVITVSGILVAGMAAAREYESKTIKGLLRAPVPSGVIIAGKMAAGWAATTVTALIVLAAGAALGWTRPDGLAGWADALAAIALASLFAAGLGIAIGCWGRRAQPVSVGATIVAVELFALSGGLGVIFFEPAWLQAVARYDPLTYAVHAMQQAVFYSSTTGWARDAAVLALSAVAAAVAGTLAMHRRLAH
jgi:ABC-type multidrug transport system permease subunit